MPVSLKENLQKLKDGQLPEKPAARDKVNGRAIAKHRIDRTRFCQELIKHGMNASAAYRALSPSVNANTAKVEGHRLLTDPNVVKILTPMLEKLFTDAAIDVEYVLRRWLEIAEGSAADYFTFEDGYPVLNMSDLTPAQMRNLKSITITEHKYGTNYKIETYDAQKAIDLVGRHVGLLIEKLPDEDVERIGDMLERAVKRIKATKDLDAWKDIVLDVEIAEVR